MNEVTRPKRRIKKVIPYSDNLSDFLAPRYWLTWVGLAGMALMTLFPYRVTLFFGQIFGYLMIFFAHSRRRIAIRNIGLCFPELDNKAQRQFVRRTIIDNGVGLMETCIAWFRYRSITDDMIEVVGEQHLFDAIDTGRGVILVGAHYTTLDLGGVLMEPARTPPIFRKSD